MPLSALLADPQPLLALMNLRGVGRHTAIDLWKQFGVGASEVDAYEAFSEATCHFKKGNVTSVELETAWESGGRQLGEARSENLSILSYFDDAFPERLQDIPDPPAVLFIKGRLEALHEASKVAVVGTREPTEYGERAAYKAGKLAAEMGIAVISGLALGCDTKAHQGCVDVNGTGVAVLAHGLSMVYPAANRNLASMLLDSGGCWVSEYPVGIKPARSAFVERNRIQSGLADGVLVVETDVKGGTMHTVRHAQDQRRRLACIGHPASQHIHRQTRGNRQLIDSGTAEPIAGPDDMKRFMGSIGCKSVLNPGGCGHTEARSSGDDGPHHGDETDADIVTAIQMTLTIDPSVPVTCTNDHKWKPYRPCDDAVIVKLVDHNPKRARSQAHQRFELYRSGMTVKQYIASGGKRKDITDDIGCAYIDVTDYPHNQMAEKTASIHKRGGSKE